MLYFLAFWRAHFNYLNDQLKYYMEPDCGHFGSKIETQLNNIWFSFPSIQVYKFIDI